MTAADGSVRLMSRIDLQPATAQTRITAAQGAGSVQAAATVSAGPISTGALSIIDAAAGIAELVAVTAEKCRASAVLTSTNATATAATLAVSSMEAIDETNAQQLKAAAAGL
jgi:hypothetical protein